MILVGMPLSLRALFSRAALPAFCALIAVYFIGHAAFGDTGLMALGEIRAERALLDAKHAELVKERAAMQQRTELLNPQRVDPDYADELVRQQLGVVRPDEVVVPYETGR